MNIDSAFVSKCIHYHKNPIVKVTLPAHKFFLSCKTADEKKLVEEYIDYFRSILDQIRIDKRSNRILATWLPEIKMTKVTKVAKNLLKQFGFQDKTGVYLHPEEMLLLLETNRLEVTVKEVPISIEKAFEIVLNSTDIDLPTYLIYKKLALLGYRITRYSQLQKKISSSKPMKRPLEDDSSSILSKSKKKKILDVEQSINETCSNRALFTLEESKQCEEIFRQIRLTMPNSLESSEVVSPDYCVFNPKNAHRLQPDYSLFICNNSLLSQRSFGDSTSVYACCGDDVAFYTVSSINVPYV